MQTAIAIRIFIDSEPKNAPTFAGVTLVKNGKHEQYKAFDEARYLGDVEEQGAGFTAWTKFTNVPFGLLKIGKFDTIEQAAQALFNHAERWEPVTQKIITLTHNPEFVSSYKMASLTMPYGELVQILGLPNGGRSSDNKTTTEWRLKDSIGRKVCAWDWKIECSIEENTQWSLYGDRHLLTALFGDKLHFID